MPKAWALSRPVLLFLLVQRPRLLARLLLRRQLLPLLLPLLLVRANTKLRAAAPQVQASGIARSDHS